MRTASSHGSPLRDEGLHRGARLPPRRVAACGRQAERRRRRLRYRRPRLRRTHALPERGDDGGTTADLVGRGQRRARVMLDARAPPLGSAARRGRVDHQWHTTQVIRPSTRHQKGNDLDDYEFACAALKRLGAPQPVTADTRGVCGRYDARQLPTVPGPIGRGVQRPWVVCSRSRSTSARGTGTDAMPTRRARAARGPRATTASTRLSPRAC